MLNKFIVKMLMKIMPLIIIAAFAGTLLASYEQTLVWAGNGLNVSFNACGEFQTWYPTSLPSDLIDAAEKPSYCAPTGNVDCSNYDFIGDREPRFSDVQVSHGTVSFTVRSKAFKNDSAIYVRSMDFGKTWTFKVYAK